MQRPLNGAVVQLVRIHACHAWGREFESRPDRQQKRSREASITSKPLLFLCFSTCKKYDYLLLVAVWRPTDYRQSKSDYYELCQITERFYAKSPNFQIIAYFCRCEHFEIKYLYIQCYSADSLLAQIVLFYLPKAVSFAVFAFDNAFFGKIDCNGLVMSDRCLSDSRLLFPNFGCHDSKTILALRWL